MGCSPGPGIGQSRKNPPGFRKKKRRKQASMKSFSKRHSQLNDKINRYVHIFGQNRRGRW